MVCFAPIGSAPGPYAFAATTEGTKRWRGTSRIACRMRSSRTPRFATYSSTIFSLRCANSRSSAGRTGGRSSDVGKELLERLEPRNGLVMREIEMQRRDGDEAGLDRFEVCPFAGMPRRRAAADPVIRPPPRIQPFDDAFGVNPPAE